MYVPRDLSSTFTQACSAFPAVLVTGPRQSGKTTFLRRHLGEVPYVTFDDPLQRELAREDPNALLDRASPRIILDEIQHAPEILPYIKMRIDADRSAMGRFLLTGSQQFSLMDGVSESLAGRVAVLDLHPFAIHEFSPSTLADVVFRGGYPDPAIRAEVRDLWMTSHLRTYLERDVRQVRQV